jgi:hypothetical protein
MEITSSREFVNLENEKIEPMRRILKKKKTGIHFPRRKRFIQKSNIENDVHRRRFRRFRRFRRLRRLRRRFRRIN